MKKQITYIAFGLMALVIMVGCNKRSIGVPDENETATDQVEVRFSGNVTTKLNQNGFEENDKLGLFLYYHSTGSITDNNRDTRFNVPYLQQADASLKVTDGQSSIFYPSEEKQVTVDFIGYYPYLTAAGGLNTDGTFSMDLTDQAISPKYLLYSNNVRNQGISTDPIVLGFQYKTAQIIIKVVVDPTLLTVTVADLGQISMSGTNFYTKFNFNLADSTLTADAASVGTVNMMMNRTADVAAYASVIPGVDFEDMVITIPTADYEYKAYPANFNFLKGYKYTYTVTLSDGGAAQIGDCTIVPWEHANPGDGGLVGTEQ